MKLHVILPALVSYAITVSAHERGPMTLLGVVHDAKRETIVFSVHYLRPKEGKESIVMPSGGVYLLIDGKRFPINSSDILISGSGTGGRNVIEEYTIRHYKVLGESAEIPKLRDLKSVVFGVDYTVNGTPVKWEKSVEIVSWSGGTK